METPGASSAINICKLCNERACVYTCPRCGIGYCGVNCYKSNAHIDCSESFYKQCIEDELKSQEYDPAVKQNMIDILKRVHEADLEDDILKDDIDEEESLLDSDDEQELPDLETRLQTVNLDDPDELWSALSEAERQEFEALLKNGEAEKVLSIWTPWWCRSVERKLIQPIEEDTKNIYDDLKCPTVVDVPLISEVQRASPYVYFNIINVIYAYAYIALYYNGDYLNCAGNAVDVFLLICENMKNNKVFDVAESAIESVIENIEGIDWLPQDEQTLTALKEAGTSIMKGPNVTMKTIYISVALSELHRLLIAAKKENVIQKSGNNDKHFTKRFLQKHNNDVNLSKKTIFLCLKKLEYYLSCIKNHVIEPK